METGSGMNILHLSDNYYNSIHNPCPCVCWPSLLYFGADILHVLSTSSLIINHGMELQKNKKIQLIISSNAS